MTYGDEHVWLEIRNPRGGLSDEFMDFIVGCPQVR